MKLLAISAVALCIGAGAHAQSLTSETTNINGSSSGVLIEGSPNTPAVSGSAGGSTAPCVISNFIGFGEAGFGAGVSIPYKDRTCAAMEEVAFLLQIEKLRQSGNAGAYKIAVMHACKRSYSLRKTLEEMGYCITRREYEAREAAKNG